MEIFLEKKSSFCFLEKIGLFFKNRFVGSKKGTFIFRKNPQKIFFQFSKSFFVIEKKKFGNFLDHWINVKFYRDFIFRIPGAIGQLFTTFWALLCFFPTLTHARSPPSETARSHCVYPDSPPLPFSPRDFMDLWA